MSDELKELRRLAEAATPGPWKKTMVSTCSGAWPRISCDVECTENEVAYEIADLPTSHIETEAARQSDEMVGNYLEKPHRFNINGADGYQSLNDADYIAAANPATILKLLTELEQAKADAARYKKEARTYQQIQRACGDLPDGWEIHICLEKDAGWVDLISPDGERTAVDTDHDDISYTIGDAIDTAIQSQEVDSSPKGVKS